MRVLLILGVLIAVATAMYHLQVFRSRRASGELPWRALVDPRPVSGARLTAAGFWGGVLGAVIGVLLLWSGDPGP